MTTLYPDYPRYVITKTTYHNESRPYYDDFFYIEFMKLSEWVSKEEAEAELKYLQTEFPRENFSLHAMTDEEIKALSDFEHE